MSNNIYNANFWNLLTKYKVEIPIIQRDYVQGRDENKKVRQKIVSKFRSASEGESAKLDFIYGNIKNEIFYPLDGQQRLTTLFLYHLYFALRDDELISYKGILKRFTYSTRVSSKEFFDRLLDSEVKINSDTELSKEIANENWFISYWKNDPTVLSALKMLDEIHLQCFESKVKFNELIQTDNQSLTFEFLELEKFGLSDDLYIKMNARGKPLSPFENLKAEIVGLIKKNDWEAQRTFQNRFSTKIDSIWTDYFWAEGKNRDVFDLYFINFIYQFFITEIASRNDLSSYILSKYHEINQGEKLTIDDLIGGLLSGDIDITEEFIDTEAYKNLYHLFDVFSSNSRKLSMNLDLFISESTLIDELIINNRITYPNRVLHYAHSCYLTRNIQIDNESYNKWMRVVRNIINNSTIDTIDTFRGVILLIKELSLGSSNIYDFLSTHQTKSRFAEKQVREEIKKSTLLTSRDLSFDHLKEIEDTRLCSGRVEFVLNFIEKRANGNYSLIEKITTIFNEHFANADFSNQIRALFLTCGDGNYYNYWATSWVFLVNLPKRCLIENTGDLRDYSYNLNFREYFENVIEMLLENDDIEHHLELYRRSTDFSNVPRWRQSIIRDYKLLDTFCGSKMIAISDDNSICYLLKVSKVRTKESVKLLN